MSAAAAARMGDDVAHGFGLLAMVAGAVAGAVIGAAIIGATAATGGMALAVVAGSISAGGLSLGQLVKGVNRVFNLPDPTSGMLVSGSSNIRINGRPAVRAHLDIAACSGLPINHFPMPAVPVAEGSASVRFNSMPAARIGSKMVCGAHIKNGSPNVTVGGASVRTDTVWDAEEWAEYGLMALGIIALGAAGRAIYLVGGKLGLAKFFGGAAAGFLGFEGIGRLGDAIGPGYRDIFQGLAGVALLGAGLKSARGLLAKSKLENIGERGLGGTNGHSRAASVTDGGSGQALAGHGVMEGSAMAMGKGHYICPTGTTVITPRPGIKIADSTGRILENIKSVEQLESVLKTGIGPDGEILTPRNFADLKDYNIIQAGEQGFNYTLLSPDFNEQPLEIFKNSTTTEAPTQISEFLEPNMGCVFWAACTQPVPFIPR